MRYYGSAEQAVSTILAAFQKPECLPAPLATMFVPAATDMPCLSWSWRNRLLVALAGHADARGFRQWQAAGRWVRKGEKAFTILTPLVRTVRDRTTGEQRETVVGFRGATVFGFSQTDGRPLAGTDADADRWLDELPLVGVARHWGLKVETFPGTAEGALGAYRRGKGIMLGVRNVSTWAHELVHAADDRLGNLIERGQNWRSETVAQLGAAVLLKLLGHEREADSGFTFDYIRSYSQAAGVDVVGGCCQVIDRTCRAVRLVLDAARQPELPGL